MHMPRPNDGGKPGSPKLHARRRVPGILRFILAVLVLLVIGTLVLILLWAQVRPYRIVEPCEDEMLQGYSTDKRIVVAKYLDAKLAAITSSFDSLIERDPLAGNAWAYTNETHSQLAEVFEVHGRHSQFRSSTTFLARNRYGLDLDGDNRWDPSVDLPSWRDVDVRYAPEEIRSWILQVESVEWLDVENHGLTHSPDGSEDLDEAEFDPHHNPNATDPEWCEERVRLIRSINSEIGLDNSQVTGFRGPVNRWTDPLLDSLWENGFDYLMVKGGLHYLHRHIRRAETTYYEHFTIYPEIYRTAGGTRVLTIPSNGHPLDPDYERYYSYVISGRGILSIFFHPRELRNPEQLLGLEERLEYLEGFDANRSDGWNGDLLWWCTSKELADYVNARSHTSINSFNLSGNSVLIEVYYDGSPGSRVSLLINPAHDIDWTSAMCGSRPISTGRTPSGMVLTFAPEIGIQEINLTASKNLNSSSLSEVREDPGEDAALIMDGWLDEALSARIGNNLTLSLIMLGQMGSISILVAVLVRGRRRILLPAAVGIIAGLGSLLVLAIRSRLIWVTYEYTGVDPVTKYYTYGLNLITTPEAQQLNLPLFSAMAIPTVVTLVLWVLISRLRSRNQSLETDS